MTPPGVPLASEHQRRAFRTRLLRWYRRNGRDLPWRRTADPYAIWLSEIMLQQTTVATVLPRWERFLGRWPTVEALAAAPLAEVLHEWSGLGYYARARNLHRAARAVAEEHNGRLPGSSAQLRELPGMGPYTAAAVASIAHGEPAAVLDANVERVLTRLTALEQDARSTAGKRHLREWAAALLHPRHPGDHNQGMMELGATVCTPRAPDCGTCPVAGFCLARQKGRPERYPLLPRRQPVERVREAAILLDRRGRFLVLHRRKDVSFGGMWELPRVRCAPEEDPVEAARRAAREAAGLATEHTEGPLLELRHTVMRSRIHLTLWRAQAPRGTVLPGPEHQEFRWVAPEHWLSLPKSSTQARIAGFLLEQGAKKVGTKGPLRA